MPDADPQFRPGLTAAEKKLALIEAEAERALPGIHRSPFEEFIDTRADDGFEIMEDAYPSVSGEQRRQILQSMIPKAMQKAGIPGCSIAERLTLVPDEWNRPNRIVRFGVEIPERGRKVFRFQVPPFGNWNRDVMLVVLGYVYAWAQKQ